MNRQDFLDAFQAPPSAQVGQRIPKKVILEQTTVTANDKRLISDGIEKIEWSFAFKPDTIGVAEYSDEEREIKEVSVLSLLLRGSTKRSRLVEFLHRAIPYPIFLITEGMGELHLSLANKRFSQGEKGAHVAEDIDELVLNDEELDQMFLANISLNKSSAKNLHQMVCEWQGEMLGLLTARRTGKYEQGDLTQRRLQHRQIRTMELELQQDRKELKGEDNLQRQVELTTSIRRKKKEIEALVEQL